MNTEDKPASLEDLLEHAGWMKALARSLVADDARADDLVQETWLAAMKRPPRRRGALAAWLRRVLRNFAGRMRQDEQRRRGREILAARPEKVSGAPEKILERAELHRTLVEAVLQLEEPLRAAVLLRGCNRMNSELICERRGSGCKERRRGDLTEMIVEEARRSRRALAAAKRPASLFCYSL